MSKLQYYGGDGYYGVPLHGKFEVVTDSKIYKFSNLEKAKLFYDGLAEGKAFWFFYNAGAELLEAHYIVDDDYVEDYEEMPF